MMNLASLIRLFSLAAIWGGSFLLMRIAVPALGPAVLIEIRILVAAVFLLCVGLYLKKKLDLARNWQHFLMIGFFNTALPFLLFSYSARTLTASLLAILNATAPLWGAVIAAIWYREKLSVKAVSGLFFGIAGVALLVGFDAVFLLDGAHIAIAAALSAACCYGIASAYARSAATVEPFANAHGCMWAATFMVLPLAFFMPAPEPLSLEVGSAVVLLGLVCTGIAYLLYFRLIADLGAASALSVTFLIPAFGIFWGYLFLNETVGWHTLAGTVLVVMGTALVTGFSFSSFRKAS